MDAEEHNKMIQDKFDARKFVVNEENWNKLVPELDKLEKKRKRRVIFYFLIPGALVLTGFLFFINYKENGSTVARQMQEVSKHKTEQDQKTRDQRDYPLSEAKRKKQTQSLPPAKETAKPSFSENQNSNAIAYAESSPESLSEINTDKNTVKSFQSKGKMESDFQKSQPKTAEGNTSEISKGNSETEITKENKDKEQADKNLDVLEEGDITTLKPETGSVKTGSISNALPVEPIKRDSIPSPSDTNTIAVQKPDSIIPIQKDSLVNKKDSLKKNRDFEIFTSVYAAFTPGYHNPVNIREAFNPSAGIGIRKFFSPKFGAGTGLYYTIYSNISANPKLFQSSIQDFGYTNTVTEIQQKRLHYIRLPLTLEYRSDNNTFSIGAEFMYLITSASGVVTYEESFGTITESSSKKEYGYLSGFSKYDAGALLMYSRRLTRRISVSVLINTGFIDVKNNTYFNSNAFDRNKSLQLGLNYKLN